MPCLNWVLRSRVLWATLGIALVPACAQIINADFSDLRPQESATGAAGLGGSGAGAGGDVGDADVDGTTGGGGESGSGGSAGTHEAGPDVVADVSSDRPDAPTDGSSDVTKDQTTGPDGMPEASRDVLPDSLGLDAPLDGSGRGLVINEVNGQGSLEDYVELYNGGSSAFDLSQYSVAQGSGIMGPPDATSLITFANGTTLNPGQFLLIVANQLSPNVKGGPNTPCNVPGFQTLTCYYVDWGVSKNGERVYLLAPGGAIADFVDFPVPGLTQPASGRSYGRFPDGVGAFQSTSWTPAAANQL